MLAPPGFVRVTVPFPLWTVAMLLRPQRLDPADRVVDISHFGGFRAYQAHLAANAELRAILGLP